MSQPPNKSSAARAAEPTSAAVARQFHTGTPVRPLHPDRVHAVPVRDVVKSSGRLAEAFYRIFEIFVAVCGLILGLPIMLLEALLIRWDSPGPSLFCQARVARSAKVRGRDLIGRSDLLPPADGYDPDAWYYVPRTFNFVKFRTMYYDARARFSHLYAYQYDCANFRRQYPTLRGDPRVTRLGGTLRKLSIDELPNLWCVLAGDMRLVGPRPEAVEVLRYYSPEDMYKFACKPGITGLAQINGRGLLNWGEVLAWDLEYIRTRSVWLDLKIILITLKYVIIRRGAF